jgi:hypothetical protein
VGVASGVSEMKAEGEGGEEADVEVSTKKRVSHLSLFSRRGTA